MMDVARQDVMSRNDLRIVREHERSFDKRACDGEPELRRVVMPIVVAAHDSNVERCMSRAPLANAGQPFGFRDGGVLLVASQAALVTRALTGVRLIGSDAGPQ